MASLHQPLLGQPKTSTPLCRSLVLTVSVASLLCLAAFAAIQLFLNNHFTVCTHDPSPTSCFTLVSREIVSGILPMRQPQRLQLLLMKSLAGVAIGTEKAQRGRLVTPVSRQRAGLSDCLELLDLSRDLLEDSLVALRSRSKWSHTNVHTWLSAVLTNYVTCLDGLEGEVKSTTKAEVEYLMDLASKSLAIVSSLSPPDAEDVLEPLNGEYPTWVASRDRRLLECSGIDIAAADVVVAQDGSGKYKTIQEAIDSAPDKSSTRYVIYVKKGTYKEQVLVGKNKQNITLAGDGMDSTIITGSLNVVDGSTTFNSATLAVVGKGFIAQDLQVQNTAGPEKRQAVALRVGADKSVINRCKLDAYQDTLYPHSHRAFFRDCSVTGTVDFIFGNAAVVFQNCTIIARKPRKGQRNMVTAQGRTDPNQNTGTSIQNCDVIPSEDLIQANFSVKSYLGRPWRNFSRTVYMESFIDNHIDPSGWLPWSGDFALKTLYYGEYSNRGPGADTSERVTWPGYHVITDPNVAMNFTVKKLIQGDEWLPSTGVCFTEGLFNNQTINQ